MSELDAVYVERNAIALAFAALADMHGWAVGYVVDEQEPDWPVLMIDTPYGQVSWHLQRGELPDGMPEYPGQWDGHDVLTKYWRLARIPYLRWPGGK